MVMRSIARFTVCRLGIALALTAGIASAATDRRVDDIVRVEDVQSDDATARSLGERNERCARERPPDSRRSIPLAERAPSATTARATPTATVPAWSRRTAPWPRVPSPSRLPDRPDGEFTTDVSTVEVTCRPIVADTGYETRNTSAAPTRPTPRQPLNSCTISTRKRAANHTRPVARGGRRNSRGAYRGAYCRPTEKCRKSPRSKPSEPSGRRGLTRSVVEVTNVSA